MTKTGKIGLTEFTPHEKSFAARFVDAIFSVCRVESTVDLFAAAYARRDRRRDRQRQPRLRRGEDRVRWPARWRAEDPQRAALEKLAVALAEIEHGYEDADVIQLGGQA